MASWKTDLQGWSDDEGDIPRIEAIREQIKTIHEEHPADKIAVFSQYRRTLDIVEEDCRRQARRGDECLDPQALHINGR